MIFLMPSGEVKIPGARRMDSCMKVSIHACIRAAPIPSTTPVYKGETLISLRNNYGLLLNEK
jgi:hypothetical protein